MAKKKEKLLRVWIELDKPVDEEHAEQIATLANRMLARLGDGTVTEKFVWSGSKGVWMYGFPSYTYLSDRGQWFNLEYFGREEQQ